MSYNAHRDECEHPEYPKKDPNRANEYRDIQALRIPSLWR